MTSKDKIEIANALTEYIKKTVTVNDSIVCTVDSVDNGEKTCYCIPIGDFADIMNVRLIADATKDGFILYPKVGSVVVVSFMSDSTAFVSMVSQVDKIHLAGVNYGGLAMTAALTTHLNAIESKINALITVFNTWTPIPNDGGAALKAGLTAWIATTLTLTGQGDISSTNVYHGDAT